MFFRKIRQFVEGGLHGAVTKLQTMLNLPHHSNQPAGIASGIDAHTIVRNKNTRPTTSKQVETLDWRGAWGGNRTRMILSDRRILSPLRLPISPPRHI
jgi:hypothetical protein